MKEKMEENNAVINENTGTKFTPVGQINEKEPKKKKSKVGMVIFILLLLLAIVGGLAYYYFEVYTNPKEVYGQIIKTGVNNLMTPITQEITTIKGNVKLDVDINLDESYIEDGVKEIIDIINNIDASVEMQMDINEQKAILKLDSNYENEELLNFDMLMDAKNDKGYIKLDQFFDDVLEVDDIDFEELKQSFKDLQETLKGEKPTFGSEINRKKAIGILNNEFTQIIKDEYVSKTKEKITINEKEINVDNYTLKMTYQQLKEELTTVLENLKNNEEFLNCYEDKEELKETLEDAIEEIENDETEDGATLCIKIYKTGLKQEVVRVDFEIEIDEEKVIVKVEKLGDAYGFGINSEEGEVCTGTLNLVNLDKNTWKLNLTVDVEDVVEFALDMEYGYAVNEQIDTMDTENAVSTEELSQADILRAAANLQESKLYELVEKFSSLSDDTILDNDNLTELPGDTDDKITNNIEKNISSNGVFTEGKIFIVSATNNNAVAVDMDIEVEYYDENGTFVGSTQEYLTAVGEGKDVAVEMWDTPAIFSTYKIYIDAEETHETDYSDQIEMIRIAIIGNSLEWAIKMLTSLFIWCKNLKIPMRMEGQYLHF